MKKLESELVTGGQRPYNPSGADVSLNETGNMHETFIGDPSGTRIDVSHHGSAGVKGEMVKAVEELEKQKGSKIGWWNHTIWAGVAVKAQQKYEGKLEPCRGTLRRGLRVKRNQACPCGSGKKFKRCCGNGRK